MMETLLNQTKEQAINRFQYFLKVREFINQRKSVEEFKILHKTYNSESTLTESVINNYRSQLLSRMKYDEELELDLEEDEEYHEEFDDDYDEEF